MDVDRPCDRSLRYGAVAGRIFARDAVAMTEEEARIRALQFAHTCLRRYGRTPRLLETVGAYMRALRIAYPRTPVFDPRPIVEEAYASYDRLSQRKRIVRGEVLATAPVPA